MYYVIKYCQQDNQANAEYFLYNGYGDYSYWEELKDDGEHLIECAEFYSDGVEEAYIRDVGLIIYKTDNYEEAENKLKKEVLNSDNRICK